MPEALTHRGKAMRLYLSRERIAERVGELGRQIAADYPDEPPLLICILNGAFIFAADLARAVPGSVEISFTRYSSYVSTQSSGKVVKLIGFKEEVNDRDVIVVEDIVDTGLTMVKLQEELDKLSPRSVKVASLLLKREALQCEVAIDYLGFEIPNKFVVGYGLDWDEWGRNFPDIYYLD